MGLRYDLDIDLEPICYDNRFHQYDTIFMLCMPTLVHWSSCWWLRLDLDMDFTNRLAFSKNTDSTTSKLRIQQAKSVILSRKKNIIFFGLNQQKSGLRANPKRKDRSLGQMGQNHLKPGWSFQRGHTQIPRLKIGGSTRNLERPPKLLPYPTAVPFWLRLRSPFVSATDRG